MNALVSFQGPGQQLLHEVAVFENRLSSDSDHEVAVLCNVSLSAGPPLRRRPTDCSALSLPLVMHATQALATCSAAAAFNRASAGALLDLDAARVSMRPHARVVGAAVPARRCGAIA